ncbi:MAG: hypothetical protein U9Q78_04090 [Chloroflexota bacterium]|nr:hypothetical protein [Chloroflexota bacterium]
MKRRARTLLIGGLSGALVGLIGAWLYLQNTQDENRSKLVDLFRLGISIVGVLRQVASLGRGLGR